MEGPSHIDLSYFTAAESLANHSTDYGRLINGQTIALFPPRKFCCACTALVDGVLPACV